MNVKAFPVSSTDIQADPTSSFTTDSSPVVITVEPVKLDFSPSNIDVDPVSAASTDATPVTIPIPIPIESVRPKSNQHYTLVDLGRGIAALIVLVFHYQHFYKLEPGKLPAYSSPSVQPFYAVLAPLYENGWICVEFFWTLSGFVFAAAYNNRRPGAYQFFVQRFSRLYPLHFATLLLTALLQGIAVLLFNRFQVTRFNDAFHFVLNLFMASNWGFQKGNSFNGSIWSVSIEVGVYAVFFILLRVSLFRWGVLGPLIVIALGLIPLILGSTSLFVYCLVFFFLGVAANVLNRQRPKLALVVMNLLIGAVILEKAFINVLDLRECCLFVFPAIILLLSHFDVTLKDRLSPKWRWLGDNSYAMYLIHFPLQVLILNVLDGFGVDRVSLAGNWWFFVVWILTVVVLGRIIYAYFEMPAQRYLRKILTRKSSNNKNARDDQRVLVNKQNLNSFCIF